MLDIGLIERGLEKAGKTKGGLAAAMGVRPGAVSEILSGKRIRTWRHNWALRGILLAKARLRFAAASGSSMRMCLRL